MNIIDIKYIKYEYKIMITERMELRSLGLSSGGLLGVTSFVASR